MKSTVIFISHVKELEKALRICGKKKSKVKIISCDPLSNLEMESRNIKYTEIGDYYPKNKIDFKNIKKDFLEDTWINLGINYKSYNLCENTLFSFSNYLAEVEHSLLVAKNIIKREKPSKIIISEKWSELPYRRYQTEIFNMENISLLNLARDKDIDVDITDSSIIQKIKRVRFLFGLFLLAFNLKNIFVSLPAKKEQTKKIVFLGNFYQLKNLRNLLVKLKNTFEFTIIGKINKNESVLFSKLKLNFINIQENNYGIADSLRLIFSRFYYLFLWFMLKNKIKRKFPLLYWRLMEDKIFYHFIYEFPIMRVNIPSFENLLQDCDYLITTATSDNLSHTIASVAKKGDAKIIELQHGILLTDIDKKFRLNDYYVLWGEKVREVFNKEQNYVPCLGFPYFDKYPTKAHISNLKKIKRLLILSVFITGMGRRFVTDSSYLWLSSLFSEVSKIFSIKEVIFRTHPSSKAPWVKELAKKYKINLIYDEGKLDLSETIRSSDAVVANPTTALIDAMFFAKPILYYNFANESIFPFSKTYLISSKAVLPLRNSMSINKTISSLTDKKVYNSLLSGQKSFLKNYCGISTKESSERLAQYLKKITSV